MSCSGLGLRMRLLRRLGRQPTNLPGADNGEEVDTNGADIVVDDYLPGEIIVVHDPNRPRMALGTVYPNQQEFRLAVRQFAINEEFELHTAKTDKTRSICDWKAEGCPWHLVGRTQPGGNVFLNVKR